MMTVLPDIPSEPGILGKGLVEQFEYLIGGEFAPIRFVRWSIITAIAAALANRVWVPIRRRAIADRLRPNLYTFLIGPQASWKSWALHEVTNLLEEAGAADHIHIFSGGASNKGLLQEMESYPRSPRPQMRVRHLLFLVQDELASDIGQPKIAEAFLRLLTKLYYLPRMADVTKHEMVDLTITGYCINVLVGTTPKWLTQCVTPEIAEGGLFRRICCLIEHQHRFPAFDPPAPADAPIIRREFVKKLSGLFALQGEFQVDSAAYEWVKEWYYTQSHPPDWDDESWGRLLTNRDWLEKLAMIHSASCGSSMILQVADYAWAVRMVEEAGESPKQFFQVAPRTQQEALYRLRTRLQHSDGWIPQSRITKELGQWVSASAIRSYLGELRAQNEVEVRVEKTAGRPSTWYRWIGEENDQ